MSNTIKQFSLGNHTFLLVQDAEEINWYYWDEEEDNDGTVILFQEGKALLNDEADTLVLYAGEEYEEEETDDMKEIEKALQAATPWEGSRYFIEIDDLGAQTLCASDTGMPVEDEKVVQSVLALIEKQMKRENS